MLEYNLNEQKRKSAVPAIIAILLVAALSTGIFYLVDSYIPQKIKEYRQEGFINGTTIGYNVCLYDIAYTIATKNEATYVVPTTNITLTVVQKR